MTDSPEVKESNACAECGERNCPGVVVCPQCNNGEHGAAAKTHVIDHGYCHECLGMWKYSEEDSQ